MVKVKADRENVRDRLISYILHNEGRIDTQAGFTIKASFGSSMKTRLLGTWLGGYKDYPVEIILSIFPLETGSSVEITARDGFGFGTKKGIESKVQQTLLVYIENFKDALRRLE